MRVRLAILGGILGCWAAVAGAHEERLLTGRLDVVRPERGLLIVSELPAGQPRRIEVDPQTQVLVCRAGADPHRLQPGALVRVSYLDRVGARPEALSILVLRQP
jgi:hypothetical protein